MEQAAERACDKALVRLLPWLLADVCAGLSGPRQSGFCQERVSGFYRHQRSGLCLWRRHFLHCLCLHRNSQQHPAASFRRADMAQPHHGELGAGQRRHGLCHHRDRLLCGAGAAGHCGSGIFSGRGLFPVALVSRCAPRAGDGHLLFWRAAEFYFWRAAVGPAAGCRRHGRSPWLAMDVPDRGADGVRGWRAGLFPSCRQPGDGGVAGAG